MIGSHELRKEVKMTAGSEKNLIYTKIRPNMKYCAW